MVLVDGIEVSFTSGETRRIKDSSGLDKGGAV